MGFFNRAPQLLTLPSGIEEQITTPFEIAIKIYVALGATNDEITRQITMSDQGATVPVVTTELGLSYQLVMSSIRVLDELGYRREAAALKGARERKEFVSWRNAAAALLSAKGLPYLRQAMETFSTSMQQSQVVVPKSAQWLREWRQQQVR